MLTRYGMCFMSHHMELSNPYYSDYRTRHYLIRDVRGSIPAWGVTAKNSRNSRSCSQSLSNLLIHIFAVRHLSSITQQHILIAFGQSLLVRLHA